MPFTPIGPHSTNILNTYLANQVRQVASQCQLKFLMIMHTITVSGMPILAATNLSF